MAADQSDPRAAILAWLDAHGGHLGTCDVHAAKSGPCSCTVGKLTAAVRVAVEPHEPLDRGAGARCLGCSTHVTTVLWPCPLVASVASALGVTTP